MPITVTADLDMTRFEAAVHYVYEHTRHTLPEIVNRGALVSVIGGKGVQGAMQRTKKALRSAILSAPVKQVAGKVMKKYAGQRLTRDQIKQLVRKEYARRLAAIGYTANVGWNNAAVQLGGRGIKGSRARGKGYAEFGFGAPADTSQWPSVIAQVANAAPAAAFIGEQPLQDAINDAARDMVEFAGGQIQQIVNEAS